MIFETKTVFAHDMARRTIEARVRKIQPFLDAQVLRDSNFFIPKQSSMLEKSSIIPTVYGPGTVLGSGKLVWYAPYASMQYYDFPVKKTNNNPDAKWMWFRMAKLKFKKQWESLANDLYRKHSQ